MISFRYIGKKNYIESDLGVFGVRKYDERGCIDSFPDKVDKIHFEAAQKAIKMRKNETEAYTDATYSVVNKYFKNTMQFYIIDKNKQIKGM